MDDLESAAEKPRKQSLHFPCNCVPELGPLHCHGCSKEAGHPVGWFDAKCPDEEQ